MVVQKSAAVFYWFITSVAQSKHSPLHPLVSFPGDSTNPREGTFTYLTKTEIPTTLFSEALQRFQVTEGSSQTSKSVEFSLLYKLEDEEIMGDEPEHDSGSASELYSDTVNSFTE
ncbi:hypothetical protein L6164_029535 [Bauhinia variegata]|uniref:Uncharacterized protein n=1 Tax=Bauhinia variegata TaxID=167791 RepID=A0ACB9L9L4_BAUVA|nr:hypothetical protein L6164_029535 [Bauhinia variegata]